MDKLKEELIFWAKRLYFKGLSPATSGNISMKTKEGVLITASGACAGDLIKDEIVLIDDNGNPKIAARPSSERYMHLAIYEEREDIKAIVHSHCPYITAFAVNRTPIKEPILPEFIYQFEEIPIVKYETPSSIALADSVAKVFKKGHNVALMANHGVIVGAKDLKNCVYMLESIRTYAETYFGAMVLGGIQKLNKKQIEEIRKLRG